MSKNAALWVGGGALGLALLRRVRTPAEPTLTPDGNEAVNVKYGEVVLLQQYAAMNLPSSAFGLVPTPRNPITGEVTPQLPVALADRVIAYWMNETGANRGQDYIDAAGTDTSLFGVLPDFVAGTNAPRAFLNAILPVYEAWFRRHGWTVPTMSDVVNSWHPSAWDTSPTFPEGGFRQFGVLQGSTGDPAEMLTIEESAGVWDAAKRGAYVLDSTNAYTEDAWGRAWESIKSSVVDLPSTLATSAGWVASKARDVVLGIVKEAGKAAGALVGSIVSGLLNDPLTLAALAFGAWYLLG